MSDGECHNGHCYTRFSQSDTHCRRCGKVKWLYKNFDHRSQLRLLCEYIAAVERGRASERNELPTKVVGHAVNSQKANDSFELKWNRPGHERPTQEEQDD